MPYSPHHISQALDFAVRATDRHFKSLGKIPPNLDQCRFSLFIAMMGRVARGQIRLAEVKNVDPAGLVSPVLLDDNILFWLDGNLFDQWGHVTEEKLFSMASEFSNEPIGENTKLFLSSPTAGMLQDNVDQQFVLAYTKFLDVAFADIELRQHTPQVEDSPPRHRL